MEHSPQPTTWHDWITRHASRFLLYARQHTRCNADAEDVLQEALVESWRRMGVADSPPPDALVFATIRRRSIDLGRRLDARGRREQEHAELEPPWFAPAVGSEESVKDAELEQAVKNLPAIYREVVTLKVWGGLTFQQIAESTGVPMNTAASRYRYGLERLRETFKVKEAAR